MSLIWHTPTQATEVTRRGRRILLNAGSQMMAQVAADITKVTVVGSKMNCDVTEK